MAISQITYSNTFSHWLISTNSLVNKMNELTDGDFYKNIGTLYLNSPNTALYVANTSVFAGNVSIGGSGDQLQVEISSPTYLRNTLHIAKATSILASGSITSNTFVSSYQLLTSIANVNSILLSSNSTILTGNVATTADTITIGNASFFGRLTSSGVTVFTGNTNISGNTTSSGRTDLSGFTTASGNTIISGNTLVTGNTSSIGRTDLSGYITASGNTVISGNTLVTGNTTSSGRTDLSGYITASGNTVISGNTLVTGNISSIGRTDLSGNITSSGNTTISGNTSLTGNTALSGNVTVSGNITVYNTINANAGILANSSITTSSIISGSDIYANTLTVNTNAVFSTSNVTIKNSNGEYYPVISTKDLSDANTNIFNAIANTNQSILTTNTAIFSYVDSNFTKLVDNTFTVPTLSATSISTANLSVTGTFFNYGITISDSNQFLFLANTGSSTSVNSEIIVNRSSSPSGANAAIRWYNTGKEWQIKDVDTGAFNKITTKNELDSANSFLYNYVVNRFTTSAVFGSDVTVSGNLIVNGATTTLNTNTLSVDDKNITLGDVVAISSIQLTATSLSNGTILVANTNALIPGMTVSKNSGTGTPASGGTILSIDSATQFTVSGNSQVVGVFDGAIGGASNTSANGGGITIKGTTDKTFNWINSTGAWTSSENIALSSGKNILLSGATSGTTTLQANSVAGGTLTLSANSGTLISTGDTGTVSTNMVAASAITNSKLAGSITNDKLSNNTVTIGSTTLSLGSTTSVLARLANISFTINASNTVLIQTPTNSANSVLTLSANTGTIISTGDTGTVTNAMLTGSIVNSKLANSSITIGTTNIALGSSNTTIRGITSLGISNTINSANGVTLIAAESGVGGNNVIIIPNQSGTLVLSGTGSTSGSIISDMIVDETILNVDISPVAAIAVTKLAAYTISGITLGNNLGNLANGSGISLSNTSYNGAKAETITVDSTVARNTSNLSYFSTTTSAQLASVISDETGTGKLVFSNNAVLVAPNIGDATASSLTVSGDLVISSNLFVNGMTTTLNTNTLSIDDKNITLGDVVAVANLSFNAASASNGILTVPSTSGLVVGMSITKISGTGAPGAGATIQSIDSPTQITTQVNNSLTGQFFASISGATEITASGGGITLKGSTDKTFNWSSNAWVSSENLNLAAGKSYYADGVQVISSTALGSINAAAVTNLNASNVSSGTLNSARLPSVYIGNTFVDLTRSAGANTLDVNISGFARTLSAVLPVTLGGTGTSVAAYCSLTANVSGTLPVANGGTGITSSGAANNILMSNGTSWVSQTMNLTGDVTSIGTVTSIANTTIINKVLTTYVSGAGVVANTDTIVQAINKLNGNDVQPWVVRTSNTTVVTGNRILADTSNGAFTITLPASPVVGNEIRIADAGGRFAANNLTIGRNSANIVGSNTDLVLDVSNSSVNLVYYNTARGWVLTA